MQYSAYDLLLMCIIVHVMRYVNAFFCRWQSGGCAAPLRAAQGEGRTAQATVAVALCGAGMGMGAAAPVSGLQPLRGSAGFYAARAMALRTLALRACRLCSGVWPEVSTVISALE